MQPMPEYLPLRNETLNSNIYLIESKTKINRAYVFDTGLIVRTLAFIFCRINKAIKAFIIMFDVFYWISLEKIINDYLTSISFQAFINFPLVVILAPRIVYQ